MFSYKIIVTIAITSIVCYIGAMLDFQRTTTNRLERVINSVMLDLTTDGVITNNQIQPISNYIKKHMEKEFTYMKITIDKVEK